MNLNRFIDKYIDIQIEREKVEAKKLYPPILTAFRGTQVLEAGYVYAPYIPVMKTPVLELPSKGIMTRYANRVINYSFYGRVTI